MFLKIPLCIKEEEENLLFLINASQVPMQVPQKLYSFYKTQGYRNERGQGDLFPPQSKYPVLHQGAFGGAVFLFLGCLGSGINTEKKKFWADYEQLLRVVFSCFQGQKKKVFF